jgi:predicted ribosome quality control (RQC) complex YloA/Tae2 family protein
MAIDNLALETIAADLYKEMTGAFFDKPFSLGPDQFALPYHGGPDKENGGRGTFIVSLSPSNPFLSYSYGKFAKVALNTPFFNSLRKLAGSQITNVSKLRGERVVWIETRVGGKEIETLDTGYDLIIELFPQRPNAYLVPQPYNKISSLYKDTGDVFKDRYMARGLPYLPPEKREPLSSQTPDIEEAKKFLSRSTGRLFEEYASAVGFAQALKDLLDSRSLYIIGKEIEPFSFGKKEARPLKTEDIYASYVSDQKSLAKGLAEAGLREELKKACETAKKKKEHLEEDLQASKTRLAYKDFGQELFLHQTEIQPGLAYVDLDGMHIPLSPKLSPVENANLYFKKYRKAKSASEVLGPLIQQAQDEIDYLQGKLFELEKGGSEDVLELKEELGEEGYLKGKEKKNYSGRKKNQAAPHYLKSASYKIGFGMNAYQNEELTFKTAQDSDIFLHVKDYPGAHVVILYGDSPETRLLAAELTLYLSDLDSGDVMAAPVRKVKKNRSKKGLVNVLEYKLITIHKIRDSSIPLFRQALRLD